MEALVHKGAHLLAETGTGSCRAAFCSSSHALLRFSRHTGEEQREGGERDHAEEQNQHGIIAGHAAVDLRRLIQTRLCAVVPRVGKRRR